MKEYQVSPYTLESGQSGNAVIKNDQSPTGFWAAEWDPEVEQAMPLCDAAGSYIPFPDFGTARRAYIRTARALDRARDWSVRKPEEATEAEAAYDRAWSWYTEARGIYNAAFSIWAKTKGKT